MARIKILAAMTMLTAPASPERADATIGWGAARAGKPVSATPPGETPAARAAAAARQAARMNPPRRRGVSALARPMPTVAPVRVAAPAPRATSGGDWRIQLGAYNSPAAARSQWGMLSRRVGAIAKFQPSYEPAGPYTRLRIGPFGSRADADRACTTARAAGQACFAVRR